MANSLEEYRRLKKKADNIAPTSARKVGKKYLNFAEARNSLDNYITEVERGQVRSKIPLEKLTTMSKAMERKCKYQERMIESRFNSNLASALTSRVKSYVVATTVLTALGVGAWFGVNDYISKRNAAEAQAQAQAETKAHYDNVNEVLIPEVREAFSKKEYTRKDLEKGKKTHEELYNIIKDELSRKDFPKIWDDAEGLAKELEALDHLLNAEEGIDKATKAGEEKNYAEAVELVSGVEALLKFQIKKDNLPEP